MIRNRFAVAILVLAACMGSLRAADKDDSGYRHVTFQQVKAAPDDFSGRKVTYTGRFIEFYTSFLPYMEQSGFKAHRYYGLIVGGAAVPVFAKRTEDMETVMGAIKRFCMVRVYGRVKKFRSKPLQTAFPRYYLELSRIEVLDGKAKK